jgi:hypothetical protein
LIKIQKKVAARVNEMYQTDISADHVTLIVDGRVSCAQSLLLEDCSRIGLVFRDIAQDLTVNVDIPHMDRNINVYLARDSYPTVNEVKQYIQDSCGIKPQLQNLFQRKKRGRQKLLQDEEVFRADTQLRLIPKRPVLKRRKKY